MIRRVDNQQEFISMHKTFDKYTIIYRDYYGNVKWKEFPNKSSALQFIKDNFQTKKVR